MKICKAALDAAIEKYFADQKISKDTRIDTKPLADSITWIIQAYSERLPDLVEALAYYADTSKYVAPYTGGMGDLYYDCGDKAKSAIKAMEE